MVHLIIMTIEHNSVEYINVPFKYALFRDKSNQAHNSKMKLELDKANKALFLFALLAQQGEHLLYTQKVIGSRPIECTKNGSLYRRQQRD